MTAEQEKSNVITSASISLAIGAVMIGANWLGVTQGLIDRATDQIWRSVVELKTAHGRLDERVTNEILRSSEIDTDRTARLINLEREVRILLDERIDRRTR